MTVAAVRVHDSVGESNHDARSAISATIKSTSQKVHSSREGDAAN